MAKIPGGLVHASRTKAVHPTHGTGDTKLKGTTANRLMDI
jgi:hypothetical protein